MVRPSGVVGFIQAPGATATVSGVGALAFQDPTNPTRDITVWIPIGEGSPPPRNTMGDLPGTYKATDLVLTADDGMPLHHGDGVALTGIARRQSSGTVHLVGVTRIEAASPALPKVVSVTFTTIKKQKAGTLVRLTGKLDVGTLTTCYGTCTIYLEDPATGATVPIDVTLGKKNELVPNTMWPLPSDYSRSSLRVVANDGRMLKGGVRVRVTGWIQIASDKKTRHIDPVIRIDDAP